jgi:guanine deaminase
MATDLYRAGIMHTPTNVFDGRLESWSDGGLIVEDGCVAELTDFETARQRWPQATLYDLRPGILLPGFVDTHVHFPQLYSVGCMGLPLLEWLKTCILPDELKFSDPAFAQTAAREFFAALLRAGTTTALVFGVHVFHAQAALFAAAEAAGYRLTSGLITSDRNLLSAMHKSVEQARSESVALIERWHGRGKLRYALTPRFAISSSPAMLAMLGELLEQWPNLWVQTHLNETTDEQQAVASLFPAARDYLDTYETHGLLTERSVFAHNVHPSDSELSRLAAHGSAVAHCPSSNAFLGSGLFPLRRHLEHGVKVALGSDVGAGTGLSLLKEGLYAYQAQMLQESGANLSPAQLLYLSTKAGAQALGLADKVGDFQVGKGADMVLLRPPEKSQLAQVLAHSDSAEQSLGALFTMAREESVAQVYLSGKAVLGQTGR